jgi:DNA-binding NtrC family response regulator
MSATVLFIDDDANLARLADRVIRMAGMTPEVHDSGESALDWIRVGNKPDAIILDWTMPGINGSAVLDVLAVELPETPVIISSGFGGSELAYEDEYPMPIYFLSKPYRPQELIDLLKGMLEAP